MAVNHQHLRAFHAIALEASVSRAARRLNVAQPTLSQQLKALEDRHRVALFEDRKPPLRLSAAGRELFALTQRLCAASGVIDDFLAADPSEGPATTRLGSDSPIYAARLAERLRARFAAMAIQVRIGNARETLKALSDAQVDIAVVSDPPGDGRYAYEPLFADRLMVAMPIALARAPGEAFPLAELAASTLLLREPGSRTRMVIEQVLDHADLAPADTLELHTRETIREGVALGLGLGVFISSECPPDPRIAYAPLERGAGAPELAGYLVCLAERRRARLMREVLEIAADLRRLSPCPVDPPPRLVERAAA
ncbi:MAG: LysR family transcriptional regulator [Caulobacteraceae bacterium]|nr:LysR family transcriptional regulator [Caulobacteraceae bacterium]